MTSTGLLFALIGLSVIPFAAGMFVGKPLLGGVFSVFMAMWLGFKTQEGTMLGVSIILLVLVALAFARTFSDLVIGVTGSDS